MKPYNPRIFGLVRRNVANPLPEVMSTHALQRKLMYIPNFLYCRDRARMLQRGAAHAHLCLRNCAYLSARERMRTKIVRRAAVTTTTPVSRHYNYQPRSPSRATAPPPCSYVCTTSPGEVLCVCGVRNTGKSTVECNYRTSSVLDSHYAELNSVGFSVTDEAH